jgi:hypothetical protein
MRRLLGLLVLVLLGAVGLRCSNAACDQRFCPNDLQSSPSAIATCNMLRSNPMCGSKYQGLINCRASQPCTAEGTSTSTSSACGAELASYANCLGLR